MTRSLVLFVSVLCVMQAIAEPRVVTTATEAVNWSSGVPYSYDGSGNVWQIGRDTFAYDHAGRLVQATINGVQRNYEYDSFGNRQKCTVATGGDCQAGMTISKSDNQVDNVDYDASGNVQSFAGHGYAYDDVNMVTRDNFGGQAREYIYTADDERLGTYDVGLSWRWTVRDTDGKVLREFTSTNGNQWSWAKDYVYREGQLLASRQVVDNATTTYHYHLDHLGTARRVTNQNDLTVGFHDYFAFGPEVSGGVTEAGATSLKYTGHERDIWSSDGSLDTLDYMHARYYSPMLGRFMSVDPAHSWNPARPQSWNRYVYALNDPENLFDEDGRVPKSVTFKLGRWSFHLDWTHSSRVPAPHFDVKKGPTKLGRFQVDKWVAEEGSEIPNSAIQLLEEAAEKGTLKAPVMRALRQYAPKAIKVAGRAALIVGVIMSIMDADDANADDDRAGIAAAEKMAVDVFGKPLGKLNEQELQLFYQIQQHEVTPDEAKAKLKPCSQGQPTGGSLDMNGHPAPANPANC